MAFAMEVPSQNVKDISKLIGITNGKVISQAMEYLRLLNMRTNFQSKNEFPRIVMCLDISATKANERINSDKAQQLIKYGKIKYRNEKNTILRILGLMQVPNIKSICMALELCRIKDVQKNASLFLDKLKKCKANLLGEIGRPQNACMAVYHSCKLLAMEVDERKLITLSGLQRKQWTQLKLLWRPWLSEHAWSTESIASKAVTKTKSQSVKPPARSNDHPTFPSRVHENVATETYEVWKKRILAKAYAELALLKKKTSRRNRNTKK